MKHQAASWVFGHFEVGFGDVLCRAGAQFENGSAASAGLHAPPGSQQRPVAAPDLALLQNYGNNVEVMGEGYTTGVSK